MAQENLFFEAINGEPQFDKINFQGCKTHTVDLVLRTIHKYNPHNRNLKSDVAWDCFTYLYMEGIFHKYDDSMAKQRTLLYAGVRNYLIDKERSESRKINPVSENSAICEEFSFFDIVDDKVSERLVDITRYLDMLESVQSELEAIEFKEHGRKAVIEGLGEMEFNAYTVMYLRMIGYNFVEMSELFNLTLSYTRRVYKQAAELVRSTFNTGDIFTSEEVEVKESRIADILISVSKDELDNTPVLNIRPQYRRRFILLCKGLEEGRTLKAMYTELGIGDCTAVEWKKRFKAYFEGEMDVLDTLNRWLMIVKE